MKGKIIKIISGIVIVLFLIIVVGLIYSSRPEHNNYGAFKKMRTDYLIPFKKFDLKPREVNKKWVDYKLDLGFLFSIMLNSDIMELYIEAFESKELNNVVYSQFNFTPGKEDLMDFTLMVKPSPSYDAPFVHGDALAPMTGFKGLFHMDFYYFDPETYDIDKFFGDQVGKLQKALEIVKGYQKTEETGRHKLTMHLNKYKSKYRLELLEPQDATEEELKKYFKAVYDSCFLFLDAYCVALSRQKPITSKEKIEYNKKEMQKFVAILDEKDVAAKLGRMMFPEEDFDVYFFDTFWNTRLPEKPKQL